MPTISLAKLLSTLVLTLGTLQLSASTITYAVGTCKPSLPSYPSISAALAATPAPNVVMVCPGTYNEQVEITQAVTLEGVSASDSAQAIIAPPAGGLLANATTAFGRPVAAQLWVNNVTGPVNISGLTMDATGNGITTFPPFIVGFFYQNTSGTVNRVATRNQTGNFDGLGIWAEGGASNPSVTVENSSVRNFDFVGIFTTSANVGPSDLTAQIRSNNVDSGSSSGAGIVIQGVTTGTVTNNVVLRGDVGIGGGSTAIGTISGNTLTNSLIGIELDGDAVSATTNRIVSSVTEGFLLFSPVAAIKNNTVMNSPVGIEFNCEANGNVHSNTITDAGTGIDRVPAGVATTNSYFNVGTIRTGC